MPSVAVGIDLGTTNSVVAISRGGQARVLPAADGSELIPSVVSFHPNGQTLVGAAARARRALDPANTVFSVKRLLGRPFGSEEVRRACARFPFELREGPDSAVLVKTRAGDLALPEISALVLREIRRVAEAALGEKVDKAVVTVPANFNELQRTATKIAGQIADLEVIRILNEPTAAALAYGYGRGTRERLAVYDFGGGTFDVTLLELSGNVFEVLATAGDTFLGGDDIDLLLTENLADALLQSLRIDARQDGRTFELLRAAAEQAKIELSTGEVATIRVPEIGYGPGGRPVEFKTRITRAELERVAEPLVGRTLEVCNEAMKLAGLKPQDFDCVILVGGSSRMPAVRTRVAQLFGRAPLTTLPPEQVVGMGAAILAEALSGGGRRARPATAPAPAPAATAGPAGRVATFPGVRPAVAPAGTMQSVAPGPITAPGRPRTSTQPGVQPEAAISPARPSDLSWGTFGRASNRPGPPSAPPPRSVPPNGFEPDADDEVVTRVFTTSDLSTSGSAERSWGSQPAIPVGQGASTTSPERRSAAPRKPDFSTDEETRPHLSLSSVPGAPLPRDEEPTQGQRPHLPLEPAPAVPTPTAPFARGPMPAPIPPAPAAPSSARGHVGNRTAVMHAAVPPPPLSLDPPDLPPALPPAPPSPPPAPPSSRGHVGNRTAVMHAAVPPPEPRAPEPSPPAPSEPRLTASSLGFLDDEPPPAAPPSFLSFGDPSGLQSTAQALAPAGPLPPAPALPLLLDVTPHTLGIETIGGLCETVIPRNATIPVEQTREFATAYDGQEGVRIRIAQGESRRFDGNQLLGELELLGITRALRGEVTIAVTFEIDADGTLNVRAREVGTGRETRTRVSLLTMPSATEMATMAQRQRTQA